MPVDGLPSTLEGMLNTVLKERSVSSFRIGGRGDQTVVTLRLTPMNSTRPPMTQNTTAYRRKCASQLKRDRTRAEIHRANREKQTNEPSPSCLFLPTPPSLFYNTDHENERMASDMSACDPCSSSVPVSPSTQLEEKGIDLPQCDAGAQTVNVCFDQEIPCNTFGDEEICIENACVSEEADSVEETSMTGSVCGESETECAGGLEHERECSELPNVKLTSEPTYADLMNALKKFDEEFNQRMDNLLCTVEDTTKPRAAVEKGNHDKGVS